jgi:hypothetical protein
MGIISIIVLQKSVVVVVKHNDDATNINDNNDGYDMLSGGEETAV